jgi:hypothetical protein
MTGFRVWVCLAVLLGCVLPISARQSDSSSVAVPPYINFSGVLADVNGKPMMGVAGVTFSLYKDSQGGAPVWMETQNVRPDRLGHYIVMLGATINSGLPSDIFIAGEARWLGVQVQGQEEQPRVLLVAVPYALKAGDAQTIRGLPPSAFVLATPATLGPSTAANTAAIMTASSTALSTAPPSASNVTTTGGTVNALPLWTTSTDIQNSTVSQTGSGSTAKIGIGTTTPVATLDVKGAVNIQGILTATAIGTATSSGGKPSQAQNFVASSFNNGTASAVNQTFQWKAEASGNNTSTPSGTLNLLFGSGTSAPAETGLKLSSKGLFTFATGQTFPGTGTITGVTTASSSGLTGGGTSGTLSLSLLRTCAANQVLQWNGTTWACKTISGTGTVTSVGLSAPASDFTVSGSPVTGSGTLGLNWTVAPTSTNTANAMVKRDGSGNFSANIVTTNSFSSGSLSVGSLNAGSAAVSSLTAVNAGTFSNTQTNQYVSSLVGGLSPDFYHDACPSCGYTTEALTGGVAVPPGAPIYQANALSGYVSSACNSFSRTTCNTVPVFGLGIATANGAAVWGANYIAEDQPGLSTNITGNEIDVGVSGTPTFVRGLNITLSPPAPSHIPGTMPATSLNCFGLGGSGCPGAAMEINASSPLLQWQKGIILTDSSFNSSLPAIEIGATSYNAANLGSYKLNFARWDAGTVRHSDVSISANSAGDMLLSAAGGRAVNVGGGGANFASLPAASNGSLIYCNDCKNVADNAATAGAACVGSGSGALARRQNNRWDCN